MRRKDASDVGAGEWTRGPRPVGNERRVRTDCAESSGRERQRTLTVWSTDPVATTLTSCAVSCAFPFAPFAVAPFAWAPPGAGARPHAIVVTKCSCASSTLRHRPVARSHVRIVLSSEAERRNLPDGWKTSARTQLSSASEAGLSVDSSCAEGDHHEDVRPTSVLRHCPLTASHSLIVLSREPVAAKAPTTFPSADRPLGACKNASQKELWREGKGRRRTAMPPTSRIAG